MAHRRRWRRRWPRRAELADRSRGRDRRGGLIRQMLLSGRLMSCCSRIGGRPRDAAAVAPPPLGARRLLLDVEAYARQGPQVIINVVCARLYHFVCLLSRRCRRRRRRRRRRRGRLARSWFWPPTCRRPASWRPGSWPEANKVPSELHQ